VTSGYPSDQKRKSQAVLPRGPPTIGIVKAIDKKTITFVAGAGRGQGDERTLR